MVDDSVQSRDEPPLTLYLSYDYLPALQQAALVGGLGRIYETLLWRTPRDPIQILAWGLTPWERELAFRPIVGPPLNITSAETGDSVTFKFDVKGRWLPRLHYTDGDLEVLVPRWTAVAVLVGAAVTFGVGQYREFLEVQKSRLEIHKLEMEIEQMKPKEAGQDPRVQTFVHEFLLVASAPNLREVTVNGVSVKHRGLRP